MRRRRFVPRRIDRSCPLTVSKRCALPTVNVKPNTITRPVKTSTNIPPKKDRDGVRAPERSLPSHR